jgi:hypothetical protein
MPLGIPGWGAGWKALNQGGEKLPTRRTSEPLVGYRSWLIWNGITGLSLASIHVAYEWTRGVNEAVCHPSGANRLPHRDASPSIKCACGIYCNLPEMGFSDWDHLTRRYVHATGQVSMTGRVVRCQKGYKAQRAEIISPILVEAGCIRMNDRSFCSNGVTGIVLPSPSVFTHQAVCAEHQNIPSDRVIVDAGLWMREVRAALTEKYEVEVLSFIE